MFTLVKKIYRNFGKIKSIAFIVLALFVTYELLFAPARAAESVYELGLRPNEQLSIRSWVTSALITATIDYPIKIACGGENDKESLFIDEPRSECVPVGGMSTASGPDSVAQRGGGLLALSAYAVDEGLKEPVIPTNLAIYFDKSFKNNIFNSNNEVYAQENGLTTGGIPDELSRPGTFFQSVTYDAWKIIRNISLSILGVTMALGALAILFRTKISPQAVFTITNLLPYVPLALIGVVLSYPIVAVALNLVPVFNDIAWNIGWSVYESINVAVPAGASASGIYGAVGSILAVIALAGSGGLVVLTLSLPMIILFVLLMFLLIWLLIKFLYEMVNVFVTFVFITLAMPFVSVLSLLPKRQKSLINLSKKLVANIFVFPVMSFLFIVGLAFMSIMFSPNTTNTDWGVSFVGGAGNIVAAIVKFTIGFSFAWAGLKSRKYVEALLGVDASIISLLSADGGDAPGGKRK